MEDPAGGTVRDHHRSCGEEVEAESIQAQSVVQAAPKARNASRRREVSMA
jgi:hypothetical protein